MTRLEFPPNFTWGAATSAYQIEGAWNVDGKGESIWDRFSHTPGNIYRGDTGDVACDHYHHWPQDIALMKEIGINSYRFSFAWSRILPAGTGRVNSAGLDFYERLVDGLLAAGIEPCPTLFHWDLPQPLQDLGGWPNRATAEAFAEYAGVVARRLGDRVPDWTTHNEPTCAGLLGYEQGLHAPGIRDWRQALAAVHHLLLSHGLAASAIRAESRVGKVGIVIDPIPARPVENSPENYAAYRWFDGYHNRWFLDPLFGRHYPADILDEHIRRGNLPAGGPDFLKSGDYDIIAAPLDYIGLNYYRPAVVSARQDAETGNPGPTTSPDENHTEMGWEIDPGGLLDLIMNIHTTYRPARIYVTENGASYSDAPDPDGRVADVRRIRYLERHIGALHRAIQLGAPVEGYFVWSLLDNFEWSLGYSQRFGIIWVDLVTRQRLLKDSARWYGQLIARNALELV